MEEVVTRAEAEFQSTVGLPLDHVSGDKGTVVGRLRASASEPLN